jgi:hypothetical protein
MGVRIAGAQQMRLSWALDRTGQGHLLIRAHPPTMGAEAEDIERRNRRVQRASDACARPPDSGTASHEGQDRSPPWGPSVRTDG